VGFSRTEYDHEPTVQTAIFRPDDAGEWKEKLREAYEASQKRRPNEESVPNEIEQLLSGGISSYMNGRELLEDGDEAADDKAVTSAGPTWKVKKTLKG
jgi:striatin 1/3/4